MILFPFNENQFSFFVVDHLLVGQLCTNPKSDSSLLSCLKVTQCSTGEIGDAPLYNSCSLPIQAMTTGPLPAPSKWKSGRFTAWGHSSMHRTTLWGGWERKPKTEDTARKTRTKEFIEKVLAIIDETPQWPIRQIARDFGVSHTTVNACVKEDLKCRSYRRQTSQILTEKTKNLGLIKSVGPPSSPDLNRLDYFVWSYVENITIMSSHNTKASLIAAIRRVFTELPPVLMEKACFQFRIRIRIEAVTEVEGSYFEQMSALLHNQVTWIDFFNKSFKIKL